MITGIHHVGVLVADIARALDFYRGVLGLTECPRPALSYPGAWLDLGHGQQLHLMQLPNPDPTQRSAYGGRDRHLALQVNELAQLTERLQTAGIGYTESQSGRAAVFCRDGDGNTLEFVAMAD